MRIILRGLKMRVVEIVQTVILILPFLLMGGCQEAQAPVSSVTEPVPRDAEPVPGEDMQPQPAESPAASTQEVIPLDIKSWQEVQQLIAGHRGKVVVVDIWSTWCVPCMREFPNLVQLHRDFPRDIVCISVNIDFAGLKGETPESSRDKVLEFLGKQQATFQNVISSDTDEDVLQQLQLASVPAVLVYDRSGQLSKQFCNDDDEYGDEGFTYQQHIIPLVRQLIGEGD
jgi:thiol-disulfide isomerase/thioredoxin